MRQVFHDNPFLRLGALELNTNALYATLRPELYDTDQNLTSKWSFCPIPSGIYLLQC